MNKNDKLLMLLIVVIALAVRLPGIFWGVKISHDPSFIGYHIDESNHAKVAMEFLTGITNEDENYIKLLRGFPFQVALCSFLLKPFIGLSLPVLILTGRLISLLYGIITVILIYFLAKELFQDPMTALASSVFLSLSGLHVTHSHYATVDVSNTFWIYATMFFSLLSIRRQKNIYFQELIDYAHSCSKVVSLPARPAKAILRALDILNLIPFTPWHYLTPDKPFYFDISKAKKILGWQPETNNFDMFKNSYHWYLSHRKEVDSEFEITHRKSVRQKILKALKALS